MSGLRQWVTRVFATRNVGPVDRVIRALPSIAVPVLWVTGVISGVTAAALAVVAVMLLATSLTGSCSIYYTLGVSTNRRDGTRRPSP